jgi:capsular exopolysaccharide synthesis family protein
MMNKFSKALAQAEREHAVREPQARPAQPASTSGIPVVQLSDFRGDRQGVEDARLRQQPGPKSKPAVELADGVEEHLVSLLNPISFEAEQYRALRYLIEQLHKNAGLRVLAVTSPAVGDGKTLTAINLAGTLAQAPEVRVLLVEADLRKPGVASLLGLEQPGGPGLVDAILDPTVSLDDVMRLRPPFNLSVLSGGPAQLSPYELLKSPRLSGLFEEVRRRYDYVVVDTPPLILFPDCRLLQQYVDGLIMIVAAHKTPRKLVEDALSIVDRTKIIGLVFNGDNSLALGPYHAYTQLAEDGKQPRWGRPGGSHGRVMAFLRGVLPVLGRKSSVAGL